MHCLTGHDANSKFGTKLSGLKQLPLANLYNFGSDPRLNSVEEMLESAEKYLIQVLKHAFLCVNDFDIVILGETHQCSKINENELNIEGYSFKHCDQPNDTSRGGIGIYYKSFLPCIFKPELTKLK